MKTRVKVLGMVMLGAVLGGVGCAGPQEAARDAQAVIPLVEQHREGVVMGIQGRNLAVMAVDDPAAPPAWFSLNPDTEVVRDGEKISFNEISEGTPVRVAFEPATGAETTFKVEVLTGAKAEEVKQKAERLGYQPGRPRPARVGPAGPARRR